ncbi:MAG: GcrA family cell cycle regulator [Rhizobiaceae bacterium]|nr:GcrA family cell cycle regulator [Rhizobiaceae bacterium]MCV0405899.1 GcrA family cell cycle regulator [Rhizobiaceae bacterium]
MNWNDERVDLLRKLWAEGLSASQIAAQLGGVSRNAVIGKVHRLKLSSRGRATPAASRPKKPAGTPKPRNPASSAPRHVSIGSTALQARFDAEPAPRQERAIEDVVVPISRKLALVELTERTCKWPNGDPLSEDFSFCGNEAGESGPYCAYHARLAFQPASERRRLR